MKHLTFPHRAMKAIAVTGIAVALTACAAAPTVGASAGTTSTSGGQNASTSRTGQGAPGVTGVVMSVNGNSFDVQIPNQNGPYTLVQLASNTQILKQATTTLSSVKTGTAVSATGTESDGVLTATQVRVLGQVGQGGNRAGGAPASGTPRAGFGQGRGANGQGNGGQAAGGQNNGETNVFGTVESASADGITVKAANGTTTQVKLAPNAQVTVEEAGTTADITPGARVVVVGPDQNGNVAATRVQIVPAAQGQ